MKSPNFRGGLLVDKPSGPTSFGVIEALQRALKRSLGVDRRALPKVGHGGTLDPFASGLLPLFLGDAVRLAQYFLGARKQYEGTIRFGMQTPSGDPTTAACAEGAVPDAVESIRAAAAGFVEAPYLQTPPMYSAKQIEGQRLHELARRGVTVERPPVQCTIFRFTIDEYADPRAHFVVECSAGTYIRVLAEDLAARLGTVAHVETLRRTGVGKFLLTPAWPLDHVVAAIEQGTPLERLPCWVPFDRLLADWPGIEVPTTVAQAICLGQQAVLESLVPPEADSDRFAIYHDGALLAVIGTHEDGWRLEKVFPSDRVSS